MGQHDHLAEGACPFHIEPFVTFPFQASPPDSFFIHISLCKSGTKKGGWDWPFTVPVLALCGDREWQSDGVWRQISGSGETMGWGT